MSMKMKKVFMAVRLVPSAMHEIKNNLDPMLFEKLTTEELIMVYESMNRHWHKARAFEANEICREGYVWDENKQKLVDLVQ